MNKNILIAYFSYQGHTRNVAEQIQGTVGGTLFEIRPEQAYSEDYDTTEAQGNKETREGIQPKLAEMCKDFASYDTIILGTPNWFNTMAPPVATFLAQNDFSGKTIIPFCTNGGGGLGHVVADIKKLAKVATVSDTLALYQDGGADAKGKIASWLKKAAIIA